MNVKERAQLQDEYLEEKEPTTKEEWEAQLAKYEGKINVESLYQLGTQKGWL